MTEADDLKSLEFALVENVQRHDLNAIEEAQRLSALDQMNLLTTKKKWQNLLVKAEAI